MAKKRAKKQVRSWTGVVDVGAYSLTINSHETWPAWMKHRIYRVRITEIIPKKKGVRHSKEEK